MRPVCQSNAWRRAVACVLVLVGLASAHPAAAANGDGMYCARLAHLAMSYADSAGGVSGDTTTTAAIMDCRRGNFAAGIEALERKLKSQGFTLPPRDPVQ